VRGEREERERKGRKKEEGKYRAFGSSSESFEDIIMVVGDIIVRRFGIIVNFLRTTNKN
jgi:hypothetical protein